MAEEMGDERELLGGLFDFTFTRFLTPKIVGILYGIKIALSAILVILVIAMGFSAGAGWGVVALILAPVLFISCTLAARIVLEVAMLIFWIADELKEIREEREAETEEEEEEEE